MTTIKKIHAREVLDSRGRPTVEVEIHTEDGAVGTAIAPSGASTGSSEVFELRDGDTKRYDGLGVLHAVANVNSVIAPALVGKDSADQRLCDTIMNELDDSPQKSVLGGNATIAVSLALGHAAADSQRIPLYKHLHQVIQEGSSALGFAPSLFPAPMLPLPETNMISGGLHAGGNLDFQDVLIAPVGAPDYSSCLEWIVRVYNRLGRLLRDRGFEGYLVGDEGGYGPRLTSNRDAVALVAQAIEAAGLTPGRDVAITLDVASTHSYHDGQYHLKAEKGRVLSSSEMIDTLEAWVDEFPIISIEDGLAEDDWDGWQELQSRLGHRILLVGDDLFTTNPERVRRGIEVKAANSVLVKVNQIGTLTETIETMALGRQAGFSLVVSARSGETEDSTLADLAVAAAGEQIKVGSIVRSERLAKYNRLLQISEKVTDFQNSKGRHI